MEVGADFNPKEFLDFGSEISKAYHNVCAFRTAMGRAYYACFLVGRDAVSKKGWLTPSRGRDDHGAVRRVLGQHGSTGVAHKLRDLSEMREHADYHTTTETSCKYCQSKDEKSWQRAQVIASDILPKLEAIKPKNHPG